MSGSMDLPGSCGELAQAAAEGCTDVGLDELGMSFAARFVDVVQEPFNVNRAALAAGRACLARPEQVEERRRESAEARALLSRLLAEAGMEPLPSEANFVLVRVGVDAAELALALVRRGLLVRAGGEFGLDDYVRITVGPPPLMERVADELARAREGLLAGKSLR